MKTSDVFCIIFFPFLGCIHHEPKQAKTHYQSPGINKEPICYSNKVYKPDSAAIKKEIKENKDICHQDSIYLKSMLKRALNIATRRQRENKFSGQLTLLPNKYQTSLTFSYNNFFSKERKHLIVKRICDGMTYVDVFIVNGKTFKSVISWHVEDNAYLAYQIKDVNCDGNKDFLVHYYPSSGCCRRNVFSVYLYIPANGMFTKSYEFINPTFSPSERIIRGIGYGQPGEVELYKYKWNGLHVDTLAIIFPDTLRKKFHVIKHWDDIYKADKGIYLSVVPKEYRKIESFEWFTGKY